MTVTDGFFTVQLNAGGQFGANAFDGNARGLQIAVRSPAGGGPFTTLCPRQPLTATPYALRASSVTGIDGHSLDAADGTPPDALFVDIAGNVGIGTTTPASLLHVRSNTAGSAYHSARFAAPGIGPHESAIHFGSTGDWLIRSATGGGKLLLQDTGGKVGAGQVTRRPGCTPSPLALPIPRS